MQARSFFAALLISTVLLASYANAYVVGTASILAPAVIPQNNSEALTTITLTVTSGNGGVAITGPAIVGNSTLQSAYTAARYASGYVGLNFTNYNFTYAIEANSSNVTGPSAGAAMTLLAVSALKHRPLRNDFTITGTVSSDGTVGAIGGVYNKVQAAHQNGLGLVLVPAVPASSGEDELYLLVQTEFRVPVVQVPNITQAALFAFNGSMSGVTHETGYNFYTNYSTTNLQQSTLACSNSCNESAFGALANHTLGLTGGAIHSLGEDARFYNASLQLKRVLDQSATIAGRGYLYTAANFAFLDYVDAFYFGAHDTTMDSAFSSLEGVQGVCSSLLQPQMTAGNYEYVLGAELRQAWGNYTINSAISTYNETATDTDAILEILRSGAEAKGWCSAVNFTYNLFMNSTDSPIDFPATLSSTAMQKIQRATQYGNGMYLVTAQQAYRNKNYPVAILDADYAFALSNASQSGLQTQQMLGAAQAIAQNSTYGVWATEFAKESQFFAYQSAATGNTTLAHSYAVQAYSSALLAAQMSQDMRLLFDARVALTPNNETAVIMQDYYLTRALNQLTAVEDLVVVLLIFVVVILAANLLLIVILRKPQRRKKQRRARHARRRRRRR